MRAGARRADAMGAGVGPGVAVRAVVFGGVVAGIGRLGAQRLAVSRNRARGSVPHSTIGPRAAPGALITSMPGGWRT